MPRSRTDDRDQAPQGKNNNTVVFIVLGAVAVMLLCVCGSVGVWLVSLATLNVGQEGWDQKMQQQAEERWRKQDIAASSDRGRAKAFLDYWMVVVKMQNLDEAYRRTSAAFQAGTSRQQFDEFIRNSPDMKPQNPGWSFGLNDAPGTTRFGFVLSRPVAAPYLLWVVKDGNEWKLDKIEGK